MTKINLLLIGILVILQSCSGQTKPKQDIYNKDFDWTITIPENFYVVNPEQWEKMQDKGTDAIEKTIDQKIENSTKGIFVFKSGPYNYFESNFQSFDTLSDGNYLESCKLMNESIYRTFVSQIEGAKVDTSSFVEKVDNLEFQTFKVKVTYPNNIVMYVFMFSRLFNSKALAVNIMYVDTAKGELMLKSWRNSHFGS